MPAEEGARASQYLYKLIYIPHYFNPKIRYHVGLDSDIGWQREDATGQNVAKQTSPSVEQWT